MPPVAPGAAIVAPVAVAGVVAAAGAAGAPIALDDDDVDAPATPRD